MALLPEFYLNTVVAIGVGDDPYDRHWIGTGFLFGKFINRNPGTGNVSYQTFLVTNKHVFRGEKVIYLKFNSLQGLTSKDYKVDLMFSNGRKKWVGHPKDLIDVAVIWINTNILRNEKRLFDYFRSDMHIYPKSRMISSGVTEGDNIYVLGFPMGLVDKTQQYVICRRGCIARIRDFFDNRTSEFLIDARVFPGNSGGPVILCPSAIAIKGTKRTNESALLGIVKAYLPYRDVGFSKQTRQPRIIFEENSGLAVVESVDSIIETVDIAARRIKRRVARKKSTSQNN